MYLLSHIKERAWTENVWEQGVEKNIWIKGGRSNGRLETTELRGASWFVCILCQISLGWSDQEGEDGGI